MVFLRLPCLIYENRLDLRSEIEKHLSQLIQEFAESQNLELDSIQGKWIRFTPKEWDDLAFQKTCDGWSESRRILLFESWNESESLSLHLVIGPSDMQIKQAIYQKLRALKVRGLKKCKVRDAGWNQVCVIKVLDYSDYGDSDLEELQEKIRTFWLNYINSDLNVIRNAISEAFKKNTDESLP